MVSPLLGRIAVCGIIPLTAATLVAGGQAADVASIRAAARAALGGEAALTTVRTLIATGRTRQIRGNTLVPVEFEIRCNLPDTCNERSRAPVGFERVGSVTSVGANQFLVSDTERNAIVWIDALGNPLSSIRVHYPSNVATRLRDRLLVADGTRTLKSFQRDGTLVSELGLTRWAASLDVATSGGLLVGESLGYERFDATGRRVWFRPSPSRVSCIQQLAGDEILLCEPDAHRVRIVDREGTTVWTFADLDYAWRAVYVQ